MHISKNENNITDTDQDINSSDEISPTAIIGAEQNITFINSLSPTETISESTSNGFSVYGGTGIKYTISLSESEYTSEKAEYTIKYSINEQYKTFRADLFYSTSRQNSVIFNYGPIQIQILGDGEIIFETGLDSQSGLIHIDKSIENVEIFEIHIKTDFELLRVGGGASFDEIIFDNAAFE